MEGDEGDDEVDAVAGGGVVPDQAFPRGEDAVDDGGQAHRCVWRTRPPP